MYKLNRFCFVLVLFPFITPSPAIAKDHSAQYRVGYFSASGRMSDGTFATCQGKSCISYNTGHNIHYVRTNDGMYVIEAPISVGRSMTVGMLTGGIAPTVHKQWFMDELHEGDKILFASKCNKHDNCVFWLPDPDNTGKELWTMGFYEPDVAKTNTQTLCGKSKLNPAVEAQVCPQKADEANVSPSHAVKATAPLSKPDQALLPSSSNPKLPSSEK